jgi:hypothetical protein
MMNKHEVEIGGVYTAKAGGKSIEVKIEGAFPKGGWSGVNLANNRPVRVKHARDLKPVTRYAETAAVVANDDKAAVTTPTTASDAREPAAGAADGQTAAVTAVADTGATDAVAVTTEADPSATAEATPAKEKKATRKKTANTKPEKGLSCLDICRRRLIRRISRACSLQTRGAEVVGKDAERSTRHFNDLSSRGSARARPTRSASRASGHGRRREARRGRIGHLPADMGATRTLSATRHLGGLHASDLAARHHRGLAEDARRGEGRASSSRGGGP